MRRPLALLPVLVSLAGCSLPTPATQPLVPPTPAAWMHAEQQADRFDHAFRSGGMTGVAGDIDDCYADAMRSRQPIAIRDCLVYDDFADRFAAQMNKQAARQSRRSSSQRQSIRAWPTTAGRRDPMTRKSCPAT